MEQIKLNAREIMIKLAKIQADVDYIKSHIKSEELRTEIVEWEKASAEDNSNFAKKYNL